jgi:8-oxo-dGTP pyrophosphatase MutT (NUDIX family)
MKQGHFSLTKGHVEGNETELETAFREIKEETNLDVTFLSSFRETINYNSSVDVNKDVVYFLAEAKCIADMKPQESEVKELYWLNYEEAYNLLTYDSDKGVLTDAHEYLKSMK